MKVWFDLTEDIVSHLTQHFIEKFNVWPWRFWCLTLVPEEMYRDIDLGSGVGEERDLRQPRHNNEINHQREQKHTCGEWSGRPPYGTNLLVPPPSKWYQPYGATTPVPPMCYKGCYHMSSKP